MTTEEIRNVFLELHEEGRLPKGTYRIGAESIYDIRLMIKTHLNLLSGNSSDRVKRPYRLRLEKLYKQLTNG